MRALVLIALFVAAPAFADPTPMAGPAAPNAEAPTYGPVDRPALHLSPAETQALLPADHAGLADLQRLYTEFCAHALGDDEAANTTLLTVQMPFELDALTTKGMEVVKAGGHDAPAAAVYLLAEARLAYADLTYSLKPTSRMNAKQAGKFWEVLNTQVWPTMQPVDAEARAYLESITKGAREGSPWRDHAQAVLTKMDAAGRGLPAPAP